jgi:hypothetical protein
MQLAAEGRRSADPWRTRGASTAKDPQNQGVLKVNDKIKGTFEDTVSN